MWLFRVLWEGPDGEVIESCTILTTEPKATIKPLYNRMTVILGPGDRNLWLNPDVSDLEALAPLIRRYADDLLEVIPVDTLVNNPMNDDLHYIQPTWV